MPTALAVRGAERRLERGPLPPTRAATGAVTNSPSRDAAAARTAPTSATEAPAGTETARRGSGPPPPTG